jgi:hypothetical protein
MKPRFKHLKLFGLVSSIHLLAFWGCSWALKASGYQLLTFELLLGFPAPKASVIQEVLFYIVGILSLPFGELLTSNTLVTILGVSLLNGCLLGAVSVMAIVGVRQVIAFWHSQ